MKKWYLLGVVLIWSILPFTLPKLVCGQVSYVYSWIPIYSPIVAGYLKKRGMTEMVAALNMGPSRDRDEKYAGALEYVHAAKNIYGVQMRMIPFYSRYELEMIQCAQLEYTLH